MKPEAAWRRLWLDVTAPRIALGIAIIGLGIMALIGDPRTASDTDRPVFSVFFLAFALLVAGGIAWSARAVWKANRRRRLLTEALLVALSAHGDSNVMCDLFPDLPVCVGRKWIYCARGAEVDVQPLDQMAWAYAENFIMRYRYQLVIWNRSAFANVLPIRGRYLEPTLDRLRQGAPWLPVGYNAAMKESWNADHHDFLALVESCRQSGRRFDQPWAGQGVARVAAMPSDPNMIQNTENRKQERELKTLTDRWDAETVGSPTDPTQSV